MSLLDGTVRRVVEPDQAIFDQTQRLLDAKTKPRRSLGRLEDLACQIAAIRGDPRPPLPAKALVIMGADHGVTEERVSAFPAEVTRQMMLNLSRGEAAINVLARHAGARLVVVDMGTREPVDTPGVLSRRAGKGTQNFTRGPAMSRDTATQAVETGIAVARDLVRDGVGLVGIGDMGIGNTTASSALTAVMTGASVDEVTGRGTGIDDVALLRKIDVIKRAIAINRPRADDGLDVLAKLGGFEIAGLVGVVLGCGTLRIPVIADGFIAAVAAMLATRLAPAARRYVIASHRSLEAGHRLVLRDLDARPMLDLDIRLGDGTGAALAMGLVDAALRILQETATFESAHVAVMAT
jgi:nicotinate-nucleotide--dimethylbenzimidazole phosphoribosyltransferase